MMGTQLLFFDTFSHEAVEELNLDLVQFPSPVVVEEVRPHSTILTQVPKMWKIFEFFLQFFATKGEGDSAWCSCPSQLSWRRPSWCHQPHQLQPRVFRQRPGKPGSVNLSDPGGDAGMGSIHTQLFHSDSILMTRTLAKYF